MQGNRKLFRLQRAIDELQNVGSFVTRNTKFAHQLNEALERLEIEHQFNKSEIDSEFTDCDCTAEYVFSLVRKIKL